MIGSKKALLSVIMVIPLVCTTLFSGCVKHGEAKEYIIPDVYVNGKELVTSNKGTNSCVDIFLNPDDSLTLVLTESQRQKWANPSQPKITLAMMKKMGVSIKYSKDYTELNVTAPPGIAEAASPMLSSFVWQAELFQVLNGTTDWSLKVTVQDNETGKIWQEVTLPEEELDWSFLENVHE